MATERTYIMIKPDGVQRGLVGEIITRFERKGYVLKALKMKTATRAEMEAHYADLSSKGFFAGLVTYMTCVGGCAGSGAPEPPRAASLAQPAVPYPPSSPTPTPTPAPPLPTPAALGLSSAWCGRART